MRQTWQELNRFPADPVVLWIMLFLFLGHPNLSQKNGQIARSSRENYYSAGKIKQKSFDGEHHYSAVRRSIHERQQHLLTDYLERKNRLELIRSSEASCCRSRWERGCRTVCSLYLRPSCQKAPLRFLAWVRQANWQMGSCEYYWSKAQIKCRTSHETNKTVRIKFMISSTLDSTEFVRLVLDGSTCSIRLLRTVNLISDLNIMYILGHRDSFSLLWIWHDELAQW